MHGAYHGGWCWDRLVAELGRLGHRAIAPDLPCDDPRAGHAEYTTAVVNAMDAGGAGGDAVLVGHSLGGFTIPLVAEQRRVKRLVFLCATPTISGGAANGPRPRKVTDAFAAMARFRDDARRILLSPRDAWSAFYHDCDDATAAWAIARLRPQNARPMTDRWPLSRWPAAARSVILAREDRAVRFSSAVEAARVILEGGEPIVMEGSHSPFLSRPAELARILHDLDG